MHDFDLVDLLYKGPNSSVYRGKQHVGEITRSIIVKVHNGEFPSIQQRNKFIKENSIGKLLYSSSNKSQQEHLLQYFGVELNGRSEVLIMEDFSAQALTAIHEPLPVETFLTLAIAICDSLSLIHQKNLIHGSLCPNHILWNQQTNQVKIIDFGMSSEIAKENIFSVQTRTLAQEVLLPYLSPEQTGSSGPVDNRSDLFSLGVVFYKLLTGVQPFDQQDSFDLLYSQISKTPPSVRDRISTIPKYVSDIIIHMLGKYASDRYQSVFGAKEDLKQALEFLHTNSETNLFKVGQKDLYSQFHVSHKLYGRDEQIQKLLSSFDRVAKGKVNATLFLVSGYAGIGKTALIKQVQTPLLKQRGYFINGKFDQFKRATPYASFIQALQQLIHIILNESETQIAYWQNRILEALGNKGKLILDVIPELELILKRDDIDTTKVFAPVVELGAAEAAVRFKAVFQDFINVFAQREHPLIIFLDDLHWADIPTLGMVEQLLTSSSNQYLFIIGAYRDNEVTELHPIRSLIQNIEKNIENKCEIIHTQLQPLNVEELCALVKDTFHIQIPTSDADPQKLAELLLLKTYGNPFFVVAFLTNLKDEGLVWFNYDTGNWSWNINNIERLAITENVVDIMATRIRKLSQTTQTILSIAASVGNPFEFGILAQVYNVLNNGEDGEQLMLECARSLWPAIQDGLVVQLGQRALVDKWLSANELENDLPSSNSKNEFCFLHDKVQQAAYELMNSDTRKRIHFIIGKILLDIDTQAGTDDHVFDIVSNFRTARGLIVDSQMKLTVAKQSLIAGLRAKLSSAFAPAAEYTTFGVQLLKEIGENVVWEQHYTLTLELYKLLLQTLGFIGKVDECEILYTFLLTKAATVLDKSAVINIYSRQLEVLQRYEESIKANLQCLELLGESIPFAHNGDIPDILEREIAQLKITMGGRDISTLTDVPPMTDPKYLTIMSILNTSWVSTYFLGLDDLATVLSARMINLSLTHGYNDFTSYAYTSLCYYWKRYASDVSFVRDIGKLGITIADKQGNIVARTKSYLMYGGQAWVAPLRQCLRYVEQALELAMECGDYAVAAYAATTIICHHAYLESDLAVVFQNHQKYLSFLKRSNHFIYQRTIHLAQPYRWLWTPPASSALISGLVEHHNDIDEEQFLKEFANDNYLLSSYYCGRCCLAYLRYERNVWIHYADKAWEKAHYQKGTHEYIEIIFYIALVYLAHHYTNDEQKQECMSKVDQVIEELQLLAKSQPANGSHKLALIEAERAHKQGRTLDALQSYERAIEAAKEYGIIVVEALAQERLGKMWETQEHCERYTKIHLQEAYYLYHNWGAVAKEEQLRKSYGKILSDIEGDTRPSIFSNLSLLNQSSNASTLLLPNSSPTLPEVNTSKSIDLLTVMQASQVISSEVSLDEFLYNMMKIIIQNAGATMGIFIQASRGNGEQSDTPSDDAKLNLTVIAERNADEEQRDTIRAIPLENYSFPLVSPLVHHVVREKETIVIQDCAKPETYIKYCSEQEMSLAYNRGVRSILCTPIIKHNELKGVLYMENDSDAEFTFTDQRIKVIGLLTAQMVISLENARFSLLLESEKRYRTLAVELGVVKKRLEEFINVLCHELRNPLNAIFGNKEIISDLLQDMNARIGHQGDTASPTLSEQEVQNVIHECLAEIRDAVKAMTISSDHLKDIVDTVLTVSMLESHTVKLQSIPFSPLDMIKMVNIMFKAKIEEKKLQLKFESNTDDSIFVLGDPYRFKEIMINLLSNAIKFTEDGVITVRYEELGRTDTHVSLQIAVEDTGIGLTEPEIAKLFQPFSQANSQTYSKYGGSGLGLKISKEIVEHMGGQIKVSSQISSGSRFYFTLNLKIVNAPNSVPQVKKNNVVQKEEVSNANYKILIVEDNIINQKLLARLIKFAGYAYELAANGKEAVDWVLKDNFDVCLMDVEMPIMNGIEATKRIRQLEQEGSLKRTHIPIIGVSANAREEFLQKALACGMDWYITKPYLKSDIYKAVDEWKNKAR